MPPKNLSNWGSSSTETKPYIILIHIIMLVLGQGIMSKMIHANQAKWANMKPWKSPVMWIHRLITGVSWANGFSIDPCSPF